MPTPPINAEERKRRKKALEDCLREGYRPLGVTMSGTRGSAIEEAARRLGMSSATLQSSVRRRQIEVDWSLFALPVEPQTQPRVRDTIVPPADPAALDRVIASLRKSSMTLEQVASAAGVSKGAALDALEAAQASGLNLHEHGGAWSIGKDQAPAFASGDDLPTYMSRPDNTFLFGALSDNHLGSKYERLDVLNDLYDRFERAGVDRVLNAGNWIDGETRFNKFDLHTHGMEAQLRYLAANYPKRAGIETYAVAGDDHEGWYGQREGVDIGRYAERVMRDHGRRDWHNMGYMEAHIRLVNANSGQNSILALVHPGGGSAYALSYSIQKIIESLDGGEKPAVGLYGHYHKLWAGNIRNVWCVQTGCFTAATRVERIDGRVSIKDIVVGDMVRTHKNRWRRVTRLYRRMHHGEMVSINYGRAGRPDQTLTATPEHPVLVERAGIRDWVEIGQVIPGDIVFVDASRCLATGEAVPYWLRLGKNANPMDLPGVRNKLSATKGGRERVRGGSDGEIHLLRDILPFCEKMEDDGWRMVPVGAGAIPDAVGFKDGKIVAFELERSTGRLLEFKQKKYDAAPIGRYVDDIRWVPTTERAIQPRSWYEHDLDTGMCKVLVIGVRRRQMARAVTVYNFEVDEDNSYIAGRVAVHNCTEDQTPFMRKRRLEAHVGGSIIGLEQDPRTGAILSMTPQLIRYFNRGFYNGRWSYSEGVTLPDRGAAA